MRACKHVPDYSRADPPATGWEKHKPDPDGRRDMWLMAGTRIPCAFCGVWLRNTMDPDQDRVAGGPLLADKP